MIIRDNKESIQQVLNNINLFYNKFDIETISDVIQCSAGLEFVIEKDKVYFTDSNGNKITQEEFKELINKYNIDFIESSSSVDKYMYEFENIFVRLENILQLVFQLNRDDFILYPREGRSILPFSNSYFEKLPFSRTDIIRYINYSDINQIYDSINITNIRAINTYKEILEVIKNNVKKNKELMKSSEYSNILFTDKYLSLLITNCIVSLCSILDLIGKIIEFIKILKSKGNDILILERLIKKRTSYNNIKDIIELQSIIEMPIFKALIEIRNDIIHNSSTIDIEKHYYIDIIHFSDDSKIALANIFFRDTDELGKAITTYGNKYSVKSEIGFDIFLSSCIKNINYLLKEFQIYMLDENTYKV